MFYLSYTEDGCATANTTVYSDDDLSVYNNLVNDGVSDTPSHALPTDEYPGYETCWVNASLNTCDDGILGIDPGMDPIDNCTCLSGEKNAMEELYRTFSRSLNCLADCGF